MCTITKNAPTTDNIGRSINKSVLWQFNTKYYPVLKEAFLFAPLNTICYETA